MKSILFCTVVAYLFVSLRRSWAIDTYGDDSSYEYEYEYESESEYGSSGYEEEIEEVVILP